MYLRKGSSHPTFIIGMEIICSLCDMFLVQDNGSFVFGIESDVLDC